MYEDSGKVYWYNPELEDFEMLYDINWEPGAEIELTSLLELDESCNTTLLTIDSVGYEWIGGLERRVLHGAVEMGKNNFMYYVKIVEGIGKMDHPLTYYHCLFDVPGPGYVRCFFREEEEGISFTEFACDYVTSVSPEALSNEVLQISPNPTINSLIVDLPSGLSSSGYEVFDCNGRLITKTQNLNLTGSNKLILPELNDGLYFICLTTNEGVRLNAKFVV
jgi:hypothetical protein